MSHRPRSCSVRKEKPKTISPTCAVRLVDSTTPNGLTPNTPETWAIDCHNPKTCVAQITHMHQKSQPRFKNYTGIPLFMGVLAEVGWITLDDGSIAHRCAAGAISVIALMSGLIFYAYTYRKWGPFLSNAKLDLHNFQEEVRHHPPGGGGDGAWRRPAGEGLPHGGAGVGENVVART